MVCVAVSEDSAFSSSGSDDEYFGGSEDTCC